MSPETDTRTLRDHDAAFRAVVAFSSPSPRDTATRAKIRKMSTESRKRVPINALPLMSAVGQASSSKNLSHRDKSISFVPFPPTFPQRRSGHAALRKSIIRIHEKADESASAVISIHSISFCPTKEGRKPEERARERERERERESTKEKVWE